MWFPNQSIFGASLFNHIPNEMFLSVVGGEDGDALTGVANQTHVREQTANVFCLCYVLGKKMIRFIMLYYILFILLL